MNETQHTNQHVYPKRRVRANARWGVLAAVLVAASLWGLMGGCADPRNEPTAPVSPGHTETIVLWNNVVSGGQRISSSFHVTQPLAPINNIGVDTPARLTLVAYIQPDADILRRDTVMLAILPRLSDTLVAKQVVFFALRASLDSMAYIDSICRTTPNCGYDTNGLGAAMAQTSADIILFGGIVDSILADTTRLGLERDSLALVLDDRYTLALWMDNDTTMFYPEAVFRDTTRHLGGQSIFDALTGDTASAMSGWKGRRFSLPLDRFQAADPNNIGLNLEVNWTVCFPGSPRPCMAEGTHSFHALLTGPDSRITATLVLVYAEERP
ncbi:hypothetical protein EHM69_00830 [candidate division KSB1 bacterium]|nr:MAG: hypothetical protein EHM69_00830 [candidate division KSB1 bacterium]